MVIWKEAQGTEMVCRVMRMGPDSKAQFHWHENLEFCQPLNKDCTFLVNGRLYRAEPGDIIAIDRQVVHRFMPEEPDVHIRVLQFPMRILLHSGACSGILRIHIPRKELSLSQGFGKVYARLWNSWRRNPGFAPGRKILCCKA